MPGTRAGGLKAAATNRARYGDDFYQNIGIIGGKLSVGGGFAADRELARRAGAKGGKISKRGKAAIKEMPQFEGTLQALNKLTITTKEREQ